MKQVLGDASLHQRLKVLAEKVKVGGANVFVKR